MRHSANEVRLQAFHRAPSQQPTPLVVKPEGRPAASMKPGQKSCVIKSIKSAYTLSVRSLVKHLKDDEAAGLHIVGAKHLKGDEASDRTCRGHQCSETTLTGESRFHIVPPWGFEPGSLVMGSKRVVHWISEMWWEWSEIAGSPHFHNLTLSMSSR